MTARDRTVLIVLAVAAAIAAFWFLAISPKRKDADALTTQIQTAQQRLDVARQSASDAAAARGRYERDYATVARLGKAVPVEDDVPSLVYQLQSTAQANHIDFRSIKLASSTGAAPSSSTSSATSSATGASAIAAALPPGATVGAAGFPTMPFTFDFRGSYFNMQRFLRSINGLTAIHGKSIDVNGRLLTVDGVSLAAAPEGFPKVEATVAATAYLVPADEGLTAGASPAGPGGATATASTTSSTSAAPASALIGSDQ
ncbi:MAG TPA: type II secretion system protein GspM [Baekduia sp.]|nr:type II secretion system protein GspM [Baekduia sp.]